MKPVLLPPAAGPTGAEGLRTGIVDRVIGRCHAATMRYYALVRRPGSYDRAAVEALNAPPHTGRLIADLAEASRALAKAEPAVAAFAWLAPPAVHDEDGSVPARTGP